MCLSVSPCVLNNMAGNDGLMRRRPQLIGGRELVKKENL